MSARIHTPRPPYQVAECGSKRRRLNPDAEPYVPLHDATAAAGAKPSDDHNDDDVTRIIAAKTAAYVKELPKLSRAHRRVAVRMLYDLYVGFYHALFRTPMPAAAPEHVVGWVCTLCERMQMLDVDAAAAAVLGARLVTILHDVDFSTVPTLLDTVERLMLGSLVVALKATNDAVTPNSLWTSVWAEHLDGLALHRQIDLSSKLPLTLKDCVVHTDSVLAVETDVLQLLDWNVTVFGDEVAAALGGYNAVARQPHAADAAIRARHVRLFGADHECSDACEMV